MLATPGALPTDDEHWAFEIKWDGVRALVTVVDGGVTIRSRNDIDLTPTYPELADLGSGLGAHAALFDGEVVALGADGRPSFAALQPRMHVTDRSAASRLSRRTPVTFMVFDLLWLDGRDVMRVPYTGRRELLATVPLAGQAWQCLEPTLGDGADLLAATRTLGLEGVVAKRLSSIYVPGRRSADWIKIKNVRTQEVVVGGWVPGGGRRRDTVGALLLGLPTAPAGLHYIGKVGTGFTDDALRDLRHRFVQLQTPNSPFVDLQAGQLSPADQLQAHWLRPELVGEVAFTEWTTDDRLRHPSWRGLRLDKPVTQLVRESE